MFIVKIIECFINYHFTRKLYSCNVYSIYERNFDFEIDNRTASFESCAAANSKLYISDNFEFDCN